MKQLMDHGVTQIFRLKNEPDGLVLSCTPAGVSLAGVPLLCRTRAGFVPRPNSEIASLLKAAYGDEPTRLQSRLVAIAQALNRRDFAAAMIAAVHTRTPELSPEAAIRIANLEHKLTKYNYNPDEPRDWHGRWTTGGTGQPSQTQPGVANERAPVQAFDQRRRVATIDDIMRSIVKNACIAECSESSLPTYNFGWKFFNCVNDCMRRHGYDPFVVR
jgi:hypothetical protein